MMHLLRKELRELMNKQMLLGLLGTMVLIIMLGVIMTNTMSESLESSGELHVIDYDDTEFTRSVISALEEDGYEVEVSKLVEKDNSVLMEEKDWKEAVLIRQGFTQQILEQGTAGEVSSLTVLQSTTSMDVMMSGSTSTDAFTAKVKEMLMAEKLGENMEFLADPVEVIPWTYANYNQAQVDSFALVNSLSLFDRLMPLILFMLIVLTAQTIITAVAAEKTDKTLETLLASPIPRGHVIGAKMLAALIVAVIYALSYGVGFLVTMLMTVSGTGEGMDLGQAMTDIAKLNQAVETLELQIPVWGWMLVILELLLTIGIALMASIILGALVQDAKSSQNASLPILVCAMLPYILSMISDIRQMEGITQILMYAIPFTHTFIATSCLRFHDMGLLCIGLIYQAVFLALMTAAALKLYRSDILFIGMPKRKAGKEKAN
ncbi:MAG: ABC transporter permease [Oscillospiraceae bacterium]|nr:ABC transporter permease [Oscillospiraceae bacterium]